VVIGVSRLPFSFYPRGPGYVHLSLVYDTLVWKDDKGIVPWLAESWECSSDGLTWTFHLRPSIRWQDGAPLTARDVRFTFEYLRSHPMEWFPVGKVRRVESPDDTTARFFLDAPYSPFLGHLAGSVPIIPEHIWKDVSDPRAASVAERVLGSGPYRLIQYDKAQGAYEYEANPDFFLGSPRVSKLRFVPAPDPVAALESGAVDQASIPATLIGRFRTQTRFQLQSGPAYWVLAIQMNRQRWPVSHPAVRQAIAHAVDRRALIERAVPGGLEGAHPGSPGFLPPDSQWFDPSCQDRYPYDSLRSRALLQSVGIEDRNGDQVGEGPDGNPMTFTLITTSPYLREAELLQTWLRKIGFSIDIKMLDVKTLDSMVREERYDLALSGHGGLGGDPSVIMGFGTVSDGGWSGQTPSTPEYRQAAQRLPAATDVPERRSLCNAMQRMYADELPTLPLYYPVTTIAYRPEVLRGWFYTAEGGIGIGVPIAHNKLVFMRGE
jgi:peptide/nickel transport system substrate-binding protein